MVYQLYAKPRHLARCFARDPYVTFGVETAVNPYLTFRCPELEDAHVRRALLEYTALLNLWRTPVDDDDWIGFTSYRQLDKVPTVFCREDRPVIYRLLGSHDILGWGHYHFGHMTLAAQAESCQPDFDRFLRTVVTPEPAWYAVHESCLYCNYWLTARTTFDRYMDWSWPRLRQLLGEAEGDRATWFGPRGVNGLCLFSDIMERLPILWSMAERLRVRNVTRDFTAAGVAVDFSPTVG